jgi:hypothetical protein
MARLTKELSQAAESRKSAIDAMRDATRTTLAECAEMRGEMVRDLDLGAARRPSMSF